VYVKGFFRDHLLRSFNHFETNTYCKEFSSYDTSVIISLCLLLFVSFVLYLRLQGWKKERVVREYDDGARVIMVTHDDPKYAIKKVSQNGDSSKRSG
jgi:hypothetical protein